MTTQIVCGNPSPISEMQKTLFVISTNLTPPPHVPFPLIQQTLFCSFKSGWSRLLNSIHTTFLLIAWKLIFRREVVLWSHLRDYTFNGLSQFFSFHLILSFQTLNCEEILYENSLTSRPSPFHKHVFTSWQTLFY